MKINNEDVLSAILYVAENGYKWRALSERFGNWPTLYKRMNRRSKAGVLRNVFEQLEQAVLNQIECICLDSTSVKVHPNGMDALKNRPSEHRQITCWLDDQNPYARL